MHSRTRTRSLRILFFAPMNECAHVRLCVCVHVQFQESEEGDEASLSHGGMFLPPLAAQHRESHTCHSHLLISVAAASVTHTHTLCTGTLRCRSPLLSCCRTSLHQRLHSMSRRRLNRVWRRRLRSTRPASLHGLLRRFARARAFVNSPCPPHSFCNVYSPHPNKSQFPMNAHASSKGRACVFFLENNKQYILPHLTSLVLFCFCFLYG